jgi:outer membrane protein
MKKYILLTFALVFILSGTEILAQSNKVGYINPQSVLSALPETQAVEKKLQEFVELKQTEFSTQEESFLAKVRQLQEQVQAQLISEQALATQRAALEQEQEELYALLDSHQLELRRRQQELLQPILQSIDEAIAEIAEELQLDYVLNEATNQGESILLFVSTSGKQSLNITDRVIQKLQ